MWTSGFYWYEHVPKAGISKHFWEKIMQLQGAVVTYLLKNVVEYGVEHHVDSAYGVCEY